MKGFIASAVTLCLLIGCIIWNGIWVNKTLGGLSDSANALVEAAEEDRQAMAEELYNKWKDCRRILTVTVSHTEIEGIDTRIVSLVTYAETGEDSDFDATLSQLREELEYLHRSESLTLEGII